MKNEAFELKERARRVCECLINEIGSLEKTGYSGSKEWLQVKAALDAALKIYRARGASHFEIYNLGRGGRS